MSPLQNKILCSWLWFVTYLPPDIPQVKESHGITSDYSFPSFLKGKAPLLTLPIMSHVLTVVIFLCFVEWPVFFIILNFTAYKLSLFIMLLKSCIQWWLQWASLFYHLKIQLFHSSGTVCCGSHTTWIFEEGYIPVLLTSIISAQMCFAPSSNLQKERNWAQMVWIGSRLVII